MVLFKLDFYELLKNKKYILSYFLIFLTSFIFVIINNYSRLSEIFNFYTMGFSLTNIYPLQVVIYALEILFTIYITLLLFINHIRWNLENIFLRITPRQWIMKKVISTSLIINIFVLIKYIMFSILFIIKKITIDVNPLIYVLKNMLLLNIIMLGTLLILFFITNKKIRYLFIIPIIVYFFILKKFSAVDINMNYYLFIIAILYILITMTFKHLYLSIFEYIGGL